MKKQPNYLRTSISLPPIVHQQLEKRAAKFGLKVSPYLLQLIIEDLKTDRENV
jgi:hypothetical protein